MLSQYSHVIAFLRLNVCVCVKVNLSAQRMCKDLFIVSIQPYENVCASIHLSCIRVCVCICVCV